MKNAYITFLNHCYIDTEVEMKEIYNSQHIYTLIENSFCPDIEKVSETFRGQEIEQLYKKYDRLATDVFDLDHSLFSKVMN